MKILLLLPYNPVPADTGNKNLINSLLSFFDRSDVDYDVALIHDDQGASEGQIETSIRLKYPNVGSVYVYAKPQGLKREWKRGQNLVSGRHPAMGNYWNADLYKWLQQVSQSGRYNVVHFDMFHMAQYVGAVSNAQKILIASDAYSMAAARASDQATRLRTRLKNKLETFLLRNIEKTLYRHFNRVCTVSEHDTRYLSELTGLTSITTVGIAVADSYTTREISHLTDRADRKAVKVLVTGSLAHEIIGEDAALFLDEHLPIIRQQYPELEVVVLGRDPTANLRKSLAKQTRVDHINYVDDYAEFLDRDWIYVYPQKCGSGLQTKLQQAMALGVPVVGYDVSFGGLSVKNGVHAHICTDQSELIGAVLNLAASRDARQEMGESAAKYVRETYSVQRIGQQMLDIYYQLLTSARSR